MTPSGSSRSIWVMRIFVSVLALVATVALGYYVLKETWINNRCMTATPRAKPNCRAVLRAYVWDNYWINEFSLQATAISSAPLKDRVAFYRCILLACELYGESALIFFETVSPDAQAVRDDLFLFSEQPEFGHLSANEREKVKDSIQSLGVVIRHGNQSERLTN